MRGGSPCVSVVNTGLHKVCFRPKNTCRMKVPFRISRFLTIWDPARFGPQNTYGMHISGAISGKLQILVPAWPDGPEGGPLSLRSSDRFARARRRGSADKYIILCERVGVCPKIVISGDSRWVQFAFRPLNKGSDDTPKTHTRI